MPRVGKGWVAKEEGQRGLPGGSFSPHIADKAAEVQKNSASIGIKDVSLGHNPTVSHLPRMMIQVGTGISERLTGLLKATQLGAKCSR